MRVKAGLVPGFFTMANMFCGYYSTLISASAHTSGPDSSGFITASWLIIAAGVLDVIDGKMARITRSSSEFGVQYDSLADVVSFGLAPSALAYYVFFHQWGTLGLLISFIPLVFGSIRLARFNVRLKGFNKDHFEGLPIPAAALTIATYVLFNFELWGSVHYDKLFFSMILIVSLLMISSIRYDTMPNLSLRSDWFNRLKILSLMIAFIIIFSFPHTTFFPLMAIYVLSGIFRVVWGIFNPKKIDNNLQAKENNS